MATFATRREQPVRNRKHSSAASRNHRRGLFLERLENRELLALVSHWTGDNTALDSVGNNHGSLTSGATYAPGVAGQAFKLDGVNDRVQVADSPSLALTNSLSIEGWIRTDTQPAAQHGNIFFRGDDRGGLDPYWLSLEPTGQLLFQVEGLTAAAGITAPFPIGRFVHVAATLDDASGVMRLYLDGELKAEQVTVVRPFRNLDVGSNPGIGIGNHGGYPSTPHNFPFHGLIDELKVYDNALTAAEVQASYVAGGGQIQISIGDAQAAEGVPAFLGEPLVPPNGSGLAAARTLLMGPDGNVYVASFDTDSVKIFADGTGEYLGELTTPGGELDAPIGMTFGPDGKLYVGGRFSQNIVRFDIATGAAEVFVEAAAGGLGLPVSLAFGPDGNLYASSRIEGGPSTATTVKRFDAVTGAYLGDFVTAGSGGLNNAYGIAFGPDGNLYVVSAASAEIKRYDGQSGAFLDTFVAQGEGGLTNASQILFHTDGKLYVASQTNKQILRYDAASGDFLDVYASDLAISPTGLAFALSGEMYAALGTGSLGSGNAVARIVPGLIPVEVSLNFASSAPISVSYSTSNGSATAGADYVATSGILTFEPGSTTQTIYIQPLDDEALESAESFTVNLSNAVGGATIIDSEATVTTADDEVAKAISISDVTVVEGTATPHYRGAFVLGMAATNFNDLTFGPDGNLYSGPGSFFGTINKYDGATGALIGQFISGEHLAGARDIAFQGDYLYVANEGSDQVVRFDAVTGAFVDIFVAPGSGGIDGPHGMTFGPDANSDGVPELYVSGRESFNVVRYDGATGQPLGTYVTSGSGGLSWPEGMTFDPSGSFLFVASKGSGQILKYSAQTGAFVGVGASTHLNGPKDVTFGPDGLMYVTSGNNDRIPRFTAGGIYVDDYVPAGSGGMNDPSRLTFGPDGNLYVTASGNHQILRFGTEAELVFTVSRPAAVPTSVTLNFATADDTATAGSDYTGVSGTVTLPGGVTSTTIRVPLLDDQAIETSETLFVNLSNVPAGTFVVDSQGVGTIVDNEEPTKFYVVDDAAANKTFEYGASGVANENYALTSGNAAPRGAASYTLGDKVWVIDANKTVYVYGPAGALLGSWVANGLTQPVGIAADGADIWIVDASADKVFRYLGASTRLSGSQSPTTDKKKTWNLRAGNKDPKDIVLGFNGQGIFLFVVNDTSGADKVFRYKVDGSSAGDWTISTPGVTTPTGITLDPNNPDHLWIVDDGTDRVYQYDNAYMRTSGSLAASTSFALAAGNMNPQGIADPPVAGVAAGAAAGEPSPQLAGLAADRLLAVAAEPDSTDELPVARGDGGPPVETRRRWQEETTSDAAKLPDLDSDFEETDLVDADHAAASDVALSNLLADEELPGTRSRRRR